MSSDGMLEAFQREFADVLENNSFTHTQLGHDVGGEDLVGHGLPTQAGGELHGRSKKVLMMLDRFAGGHADSYLEWLFDVLFAALGQVALNLRRATNGRGRRNKRRHNAIPGVLDLASIRVGQRVADNLVVSVNQFHSCLVAGLLRESGRVHDVGKENGPNAGIKCRSRAARNQRRSRGMDTAAAKERFGNLGRDLDDFFRDQPVSFTVDLAGGLGRWGLYETINFITIFMRPVLEILNTVLSLGREISQVRFRDIFRRHAAEIVNVHVQRHNNFPDLAPLRLFDLDAPNRSQGLENDAVSLGQPNQRGALFFRSIGVEFKAQAEILETDRHLLRNGQGSTKIEIALGSDDSVPQLYLHGCRDRPQGHARTRNQGLQKHISRASQRSIPAHCRMRAGGDEALDSLDVARHFRPGVAGRAQGHQRGSRVAFVLSLERTLNRLQFFSIHRIPARAGRKD